MTPDPNPNAVSSNEINETTASQSENATREDATGDNAPHVWLPAPTQDSPAAPPQERRSAVMTWLITGAALLFLAWRFPAAAKTTVVFIVILSVLVFVHEWGHYQFARWGGMKVNRFAIGFPPFIYTRRHNDIDYSIGALPIGGMVDIAGLGSEEEMVATSKGESRPVQPPRPQAPHGQKQFQDASLGWRFWTLFAGPMMNFVFALVVFVGLFSIVGLPPRYLTTNVHKVQAGMPAAVAGIKPGDRVVAINDTRSENPLKMAQEIPLSKGQPVTIVVERNGQTLQKTVSPVWQGKGDERALRIGIEWLKDLNAQPEKVGFAAAMAEGWKQSYGITELIGGFLRRAATFQLSKEDRREVGGPVKIAQAVGESARSGMYELLLLSAMLSVNLGMLNLLPFPALDGGRILFLGYELIARRPLDPAKENLAHMFGMVMLLAFMLFITLRDVLGGLKIF